MSEIQEALFQLRLLTSLLLDPQTQTAGYGDEAGSPSEVLRDATKTLKAAGVTVALTIEGDTDTIPPDLWPTIRAAVGEAASNIERHASKSGPCALILSIDHQWVDMVFINETVTPGETRTSSGDSAMGLLWVRERITPIGGELTTLQEDKQWMTHVRIPLGAQQSSR